MAEITVVGAGLSGLVAAINCVRSGHDVTVLERYERVGGKSEYQPRVDGTALRPELLGEFIGVALGPPQINACARFPIILYGKELALNPARCSLSLVERGSRSTSLDSYLYEVALGEGVKFEFGWKLRSQADLSDLPPNSIIATGINAEPFKLLGIPYTSLVGYHTVVRYDGPPTAIVWFDHYTKDYAFFLSSNDVATAMYMNHPQVDESGYCKWRRLFPQQSGVGVECKDFGPVELAVGTRRFKNQNLFYGDKILAGTLAGVQDPFWSFGVHSSLISGRIAALAVDDRARAGELFNQLTSRYKFFLLCRKLLDATPRAIRKAEVSALVATVCRFEPLQGFPATMVPGFSKLKRWCREM